MSLLRAFEGNRLAIFLRNPDDARSSCEAALALYENAANDVAVDVSGFLTVVITARRDEDTRPSGNFRAGQLATSPGETRVPLHQADELHVPDHTVSEF